MSQARRGLKWSSPHRCRRRVRENSKCDPTKMQLAGPRAGWYDDLNSDVGGSARKLALITLHAIIFSQTFLPSSVSVHAGLGPDGAGADTGGVRARDRARVSVLLLWRCESVATRAIGVTSARDPILRPDLAR